MSEIFARRLREVRENRKLTQTDVAKKLGMSYVAYGHWERGDNEPPLAKLVFLCRLFDVSADWLLGIERTNDAGRMAALRSEAEQAAATLHRLVEEVKQMEKTR